MFVVVKVIPGSKLDPVLLVLGALLACCVTVITILMFYINGRRVCENCKGKFTIIYFFQSARSQTNERDPTAVKMADQGAAIYLIHAGSPKRKFLLRVM